mmetsp:Transcript_19990/g.28989  ORF Transcript_19990/g.28989 Transcript_19990/m.28989 type:complete len:750 (+) Transcript_19990:36-2285(+)
MMALSLTLKCILFASVFLVGVAADEQKSQVNLPLEEFQKLFTSAQVEEAKRLILDKYKIDEDEHKQKLKALEAKSKLLDNRLQQQKHLFFPENFQVLQHTASGMFNSSAEDAGVDGDVASFDIELTFRVMESSKWTKVPLVNTTSTVSSNWEVSQQAIDSNAFHTVDTVTGKDEDGVLLFLRNDQQVLATNQSGLFKVKYNAYTRVSKSRNLNAMGLSNLLYPLSGLSFQIATDASQSVKEFSVQPPSSVLRVKSGENYTNIIATLPLTADSFQIKWVDFREDFGQAKAQKEDSDSNVDTKSKQEGPEPNQDRLQQEFPQVTANHEVMHTIGEGTIRSLHSLEFKSSSEMPNLSSVQFLVHGDGVRVTSVVGHALQSWTVEEAQGTTSSSLVKAIFKTSQLDSTVALKVHTEKDRSDLSDILVELPRIECKNVLRQTGHVAIIKDANVEVHEHKTFGLSRCEPSDLSSKLRLNVDRPIVLSYKYLNPQNSAVLSVKEHAAMETLEATIDRIHYKALVTETHTFHSIIMLVQSTKLQYLEMLGLPTTASKFTVMVNSVPAKPVQGDGRKNSILVPLLIGLDQEAANEGGNLRTSVEVSYFSTHDNLGKNGTLSLNPPWFELPISVVTAHLRLPMSDENPFNYTFSGDFGSKPLRHLDYPIPDAFSYTTAKRVVPDDYEFSIVDDMWPEDEENDRSASKVGAVKIVTPLTGRSFFFQRLLVVDKELALNVTFKEKEQPVELSWWQRLIRKT